MIEILLELLVAIGAFAVAYLITKAVQHQASNPEEEDIEG